MIINLFKKKEKRMIDIEKNKLREKDKNFL